MPRLGCSAPFCALNPMVPTKPAGGPAGGSFRVVRGGGAPREDAMRAATCNPLIRDPANHYRLACVRP
eukprot:12682097-Alexandrium_andersonii.AAC.1